MNATQTQASNARLRSTENVWRDSWSGGYIAEVRGLLDQRKGCYDWVRLGVYGSCSAAVAAVVRFR